jgi:hypothetical protein
MHSSVDTKAPAIVRSGVLDDLADLCHQRRGMGNRGE